MSAGATLAAPPVTLEPGAVMAKAASENFPVALRILPRRQREQLLAVYAYARFVDDVGDLAAGDRRAQLDWVEAELDRALAGTATHPVLVGAGELARALGTGRQPFADLLAANRQDQEVTRYATFDDLAAYCALSANPVGHLVLAVFGIGGSLARQRSDDICTALQVIEHLQDVAEDHAVGRVYLPSEDCARFGVEPSDLAAPHASAALRRLVAFECGRARRLLGTGAPLVASATGAARAALAGFVGGGLAQLDALAACEYDVLGHTVKASKLAVARRALALVRHAGADQ